MVQHAIGRRFRLCDLGAFELQPSGRRTRLAKVGVSGPAIALDLPWDTSIGLAGADSIDLGRGQSGLPLKDEKTPTPATNVELPTNGEGG